ncbi:glycosyltransferase 28 [Exidia glandulosa HHB12029]|uniref:UDP-N-acetylglucosamine transferase subunit ALG13 n=1 Tax=Exidia glandulosa HHB12029 TaxID=1314781 RepID=A0A165BCC8_EXIGL|nr:glycosyltransferase 28 [Exidia glandulosa HHB12029]
MSPRSAFLTVGATAPFDALLSAVLADDALRALRDKGYTRLEVQCGKTQLPDLVQVSSAPWHTQRQGVDISLWDFKPSLSEDIKRADLVISHAGSGTIVDVLRLGKALIVVPNTALLHNHQEEVARALHERRHLISCSVPDVARAIRDLDTSSLIPFPAFDGSEFQTILDEEMGFI